jgi:hypothetical protein
MTDYFVRNLTPRKYQIAKFEDGKEPTEIYTVTENTSNDYFHCDCQGFRRNQSQEHKHIRMAMLLSELGFNHFDEDVNGEKVLDF